MDYVKRLIMRVLVLLIIAITGNKLFYFLFSKLTFYLSYLSVYFYNPIIIGDSIIINNLKLNFIPVCTAASAYFLLTILILLTKDIGLKKKIYMFLIGSSIILIANVIRIFILILILIEYGSSLFQTLHLFFWKVIATLFVVLTWIFLTYFFKVKTIPVYSDIKELIKLKKTKNTDRS